MISAIFLLAENLKYWDLLKDEQVCDNYPHCHQTETSFLCVWGNWLSRRTIVGQMNWFNWGRTELPNLYEFSENFRRREGWVGVISDPKNWFFPENSYKFGRPILPNTNTISKYSIQLVVTISYYRANELVVNERKETKKLWLVCWVMDCCCCFSPLLKIF